MEYFEQLLDLLKTEKQEDQNAYNRLAESTTVADRRAGGLSWYPIAIRGTELSRGDYLVVEIERTTHLEMNHQLRFGASAVLFSNHDSKKDRLEGVITHQSGNRLKLHVRTDELPGWTRDGKLGVDLLFDNNSYQEMEHALKQAGTASDQAGSNLVNILTGAASPSFDLRFSKVSVDGLNLLQQAAVNQILAASDLAIVHGPPGTGKTTTLVQAICLLVRQSHQQVLVVAPSNTAVDLLSGKLADQGLNVLRIGNPARVSESLTALTLDSKMAGHAGMKEIRNLKKQAAAYKDMAHKYKRNFGRAEQEQRKALFSEAHKILKEAGRTEQYITDDLLDKVQVITATLVGANHYILRDRSFPVVVVDEAGQALEPACWIPILKASKVVFAGDHCQLPPTVKSTLAAKKGLGISLLEKCVALHPQSVTLLQEQYRMNEPIMGYSSKVFYEDRLQAHCTVADRTLFPGDQPLVFMDTAGCSFEERTEGTSVTNPGEAAFLIRQVLQLYSQLQLHYTSADFPSIGIISPYRQQVHLLKELLGHADELQPYQDKISVNTIDSFQGQECDVIYISLTRSNAEGLIGFLQDTRRMNVAMTRARMKLVVIGDSATLSRSAFYTGFIDYAEKQGAYKSAWEFME